MISINKALYVHTPKTAGSWIERVLLDNGGKRVSYSHDIPKNHQLYISLMGYRPFTLVRHPLEYVHSIWKHWSGAPVCRLNNSDSSKFFMWDKEMTAQFYCDSIVEGDFELTLHNFTRNWPGFVSWLYGQFTFGCWYVGKYESLQAELLKALSLCGKWNSQKGLPPSLISAINSKPALNVSQGKDCHANRGTIDAFMSAEPAVQLYNYNYIPSRFISK
jgi:hypothetical protein